MLKLVQVKCECGKEIDAYRAHHYGDEYCQECCEHEFDASEGFTCLNCGMDGSEEVLSAAYDRAKDARKYGV